MLKKILAFCTALVILPSTAMDLQQTFELAKTQDQTYLSALSLNHAESYDSAIAWANVLPQFDITANSIYHNQSATPKHYNQNSYTLTLTQSLIELDQWKRIAQANKQQAIAELSSKLALLDLIARTTSAYFDILAASDQLRYAQKNEQALQEQYHQTEQRFQVGNIPQSDLQLMLAAYAQAQAVTIHQDNDVNIKKAALAKIIGQVPDHLKELGQQFTPTIPEPNNENAWVSTAFSKNLLIQQSMLRAQIQNDEIIVAGSGYLPSLKAAIARTGSSNHDLSTGKNQDTTMGLTVNLNLLNGGGTFSSVRKAQHTYQSGLQTLEGTKRDVATQVRQDYLSLLSGLSQIKAFAQAVSSAQASFNAAQAAYQAGTYTIAAVLQEQTRLFSSEQKYAAAKYEFIRNWVQLKLDSGVLNEKDLATINEFLTLGD